MLQPFDRFRLETSFEVPEHLKTFADTASGVLKQAHTEGLQLEGVSVRTAIDHEARRLYIERPADTPIDRELLAIHMGRAADWLSVSFSHSRHTLWSEQYAQPMSTVVIEESGSRAYSRNPLTVGTEQSIQSDKEAGSLLRNRLFVALGAVNFYGLDEARELVAQHNAEDEARKALEEKKAS